MLHKNLLSRLIVLIAFLTFSITSDAQDGKALFKANCASCHAQNMVVNATGPALGGVQERWEGREDILKEWIRNSQKVIASGDAYAVNLFNEWNKSAMTAFPNLKDEEIAEILLYIDGIYPKTPPNKYTPEETVAAVADDENEKEGNQTLVYGLLLGGLVVLSLILARIITHLQRQTEVLETGSAAPRKTLLEMLTDKRMISFLIFALIVVGGFKTVNNAIDLGRQQDYQPDQPIKFSHETHAGINGIDCQYCHDGARRSKHAVIPATNTCMNCHAAIKEGPTYGRAELTKIFASAGYDPIKGAYIDNYGDMSEEEALKLFGQWILDGYMSADEKRADSEIKYLANQELEALKPFVNKPIEWTRIHNLPDHVYFNHSQHVSVGGLECQTCHGKVEEMEVVYQHAPLSMGWCVNCHRQKEVKFADNPYYEAYDQYHHDLEEGKMDKVTVEDIGGLECQKCHY